MEEPLYQAESFYHQLKSLRISFNLREYVYQKLLHCLVIPRKEPKTWHNLNNCDFAFRINIYYSMNPSFPYGFNIKAFEVWSNSQNIEYPCINIYLPSYYLTLFSIVAIFNNKIGFAEPPFWVVINVTQLSFDVVENIIYLMHFFFCTDPTAMTTWCLDCISGIDWYQQFFIMKKTYACSANKIKWKK
jgi:hypothetical protein